MTLADISLPKVIGDNMVLQRDQPITVWGWANPSEKVEVRFSNQRARTTTDKSGKWKVQLKPMPAGGPYEMTISGKNSIVLKNILLGDVWICSGQSNMEWIINNSDNAEQEIANANFPKIRLFTVPRNASVEPVKDATDGQWVTATQNNIANFSAVGYFFGRELHQELDVPIGLINTSWGGTVIETWISTEAIQQSGEFPDQMAKLKNLDLDKEVADLKAKMQAYLPETNDLDKFENGQSPWASSHLNDKDWHQMSLPTLWENQLPSLDGVVWFRKTFTLPENFDKQRVVLSLGPIDDADITWINGQKVGETQLYNVNREYKVDGSFLKPGENVIAVRVVDTGGGGGLYGSKENMYIQTGNEKTDLSGNWKFKISTAYFDNLIDPNSYPTLLYNGMIHPLVQFSIKGAIWYQGESNTGRSVQYQKLFPLMINNWREKWNIGDFPFLFVQLANYLPYNGKETPDQSWAQLREVQTKTLATVPNTGMAVTIDVGNPYDIHPTNKQDVGKRLALAAKKVAYGKDIIYSGPSYKNIEVKDASIIVHFDHVGTGLNVDNEYGYVMGFQIAGVDGKYHWAKAEIIDNSTVKVYHKDITRPVSVRYAWRDNPEDANLYNSAGLPAIPFRSKE